LPLHASRYDKDGQATCLLEEFTVAYAPNVQAIETALREVQRRNRSPFSLLAIADPNTGSPPLQWALFEIDSIAAFFAGNARSMAQGDEINDADLLKELQSATHLHCKLGWPYYRPVKLPHSFSSGSEAAKEFKRSWSFIATGIIYFAAISP
jgi:CHAT domain